MALEQPIDQAMARSIELAKQAAQAGEVPVGAVILSPDGVSILAEAHNLRESAQDPTGHAEILAIREAAKSLKSWRLEECTLVVTLEPCLMCLAACQQARLSLVVYGAADPKGGALSLGYRFQENERLHHRFEVRSLDEASVECGKLLTDFFSKKRLEKSAKKSRAE